MPGEQMSELDAKYRVSEQASAAMRVGVVFTQHPLLAKRHPQQLVYCAHVLQAAGQAASRTAAAFGSSARFVSAKALENERV